jgi:hypothetical protein
LIKTDFYENKNIRRLPSAICWLFGWFFGWLTVIGFLYGLQKQISYISIRADLINSCD